MNNNNHNDISPEAKIKKDKDEFSLIIIGLISYGLILIAIVMGTFFAVKNVIRTKDSEAQMMVSGEEEDVNDSAEDIVEASEENIDDVIDEEPVLANSELKEHRVDVSEYMTDDGKIDYKKNLFIPGKRSAKLKWKDVVFSALEDIDNPKNAVINTYNMVRKYAINSDNKDMEYEIYSDPETGIIRKITSIEKCSDRLDVIDFYYDNGELNYADERFPAIDIPVDISSGQIASRFYFNEDTLVKYSYCENNKATVFYGSKLLEYSDGTAEQYVYLEAEMINKAYITYNAAISLANVQRIEGYILDEYDQVMTDVNISLFSNTDKSDAVKTVTDGDGYYYLEVPVDNDKTYTLLAEKNSLDEVRIYGITARPGSGVYCVPTPRMTYSDDGAEYNEQIFVRDAIDNNMPLEGATVTLRNGFNCREGEAIKSVTLDSTGAAVVTVQAGNYTAEIVKGGYETAYCNIIVDHSKQASILYAVKDLSESELLVLLYWNKTPLDLEARIISAGAASMIKSEVDSVGSLATETIRFDRDSDVYTYYVSDFSGISSADANSSNMSASEVRADVYGCEGLIASYEVPASHLGVVWEPFIIRNSGIIPVNHYYNSFDQGSCFTSK